jgi:hypothetical protein
MVFYGQVDDDGSYPVELDLWLKYAKGPCTSLRGRLSFSPCISKTFQIFPALLVNFKKGHWFDFLANVSLFFTGGTDD